VERPADRSVFRLFDRGVDRDLISTKDRVRGAYV
jgi:hypothetical protein